MYHIVIHVVKFQAQGYKVDRILQNNLTDLKEIFTGFDMEYWRADKSWAYFGIV